MVLKYELSGTTATPYSNYTYVQKCTQLQKWRIGQNFAKAFGESGKYGEFGKTGHAVAKMANLTKFYQSFWRKWQIWQIWRNRRILQNCVKCSHKCK